MNRKTNALNFELIVGITTALITITGGFFPIVAYGQLIYTPVPRQSPVQSQTSCSTGWYITGYNTPKETDYSGATKRVFVQGVGYARINNAFLKDVSINGAGLTRFGWFIADYGNGWVKVPYPQDAQGNELKAGISVATDPSVIPTGTSGITISTLPSPWNGYQYKAVDTGPGITGKHIDVYTGIGANAKQEAFRITSNGNTVCYPTTS